MIINPFIYFFLFHLLISTLILLNAQGPILAAIALAFSFINLAFILICMNFEFLALILLIVYIGAIIILFLFMILLLHIKEPLKTTSNFSTYTPFFLLLLFIPLCILHFSDLTISPVYREAVVSLFSQDYLQPQSLKSTQKFFEDDLSLIIPPSESGLTQRAYNVDLELQTEVGSFYTSLYTYGSFYFISVSLLLLIALLGAVILITSEHSEFTRNQQTIIQDNKKPQALTEK